MFYIVLRFNISKAGQEAHSEQRYDDETQAMKRFYNILAADIDSENYSFELVQVIRSTDGSAIANQVFTYEEPEAEPSAD